MKKQGRAAVALSLKNPDQSAKLCLHRCHHLRRGFVEVAGLAMLPVNAPHRVGQDRACDLQPRRQIHFKGISLDRVGDRDNDGHSAPLVVRLRGQHDGGTPSGLLVSNLPATELDLNQVAGVGNVGGGYHTSLPTGRPQSCSRWRLRSVMPATNFSRVISGVAASRAIRPPSTRMVSSSPSRKRASLSTSLGKRTAWLFPHFTTFTRAVAVVGVIDNLHLTEYIHM